MAETKPEVVEKKSSKKLILIILLIQSLLIAAGAAYYIFIYKSAESAHSDSEAASEKNGENEEVEPDAYYEMEGALIVNFPPGASAKIIKISLSVLVQGEAGVEVLQKHEPMIRNNLLMVIASMGADRLKTLEGKQELQEKMLSEIGKVMEKMAGKNTAKQVYFTEFVMQ